jgi:hypothetical protein
MASLENPNPREIFDKNEAGIAQTKQAIAEAAASGDYDKVGALAQEAKNMEAAKGEMVGEVNRGIDEAKAAEEKAKRDAELAEQAKLQAEKASQEAAQLLEKMQGGSTESPSTEKAEEVASENEPIDAIALNNKIVNMRSEREKTEALANLSQQEISAAAQMIAKSKDGSGMLDTLTNFGNKQEIISQPEIIEAFKNNLANGMHPYDIERVLTRTEGLPDVSKEIFDDPAVKNGVQNSVKNFVSYQTERDWPHVVDSIDRVVKGINMSDQELRNIAEGIKGNHIYQQFVQHFGMKRLYPEMNQ